MFTGFSQATFDFLYGIYLNNERVWFEQHKSDYQTHLYRPMAELSREVFSRLTQLCPDRDMVSKVARIYKDARRYHGMSPYKESLWFSIRGPVELWEDTPTFWFELCRDSWNYGLGFYAPKAATMARHRARIDRDPNPLRRLRGELLGQREFTLEGESYAKFKPCAATDLAGWYNYKSFSILHTDTDLAPVCDAGLADRLTEGFRFLMPYYDYFFPLCEGAQGAIPG